MGQIFLEYKLFKIEALEFKDKSTNYKSVLKLAKKMIFSRIRMCVCVYVTRLCGCDLSSFTEAVNEKKSL